jgi:hypothetical protein
MSRAGLIRLRVRWRNRPRNMPGEAPRTPRQRAEVVMAAVARGPRQSQPSGTVRVFGRLHKLPSLLITAH